MGADDEVIADAQGAVGNKDGGDGAFAFVQLGFDDRADGVAFRIGFEFQHFSDELNRVEQIVDAGAFECRDVTEGGRAAPIVRKQVKVGEFLLDAFGIDAGFVHFIDGDDDRAFRRFRVVDRFFGLGHDAIVGGDDQDDDVGHFGAAGAHFGESGVSWRIDEGDRFAIANDLIGADVLRDSAGFGLDDARMADGVEKGGLAVVDVAHDGDDRGTLDEQFGIVDDVHFFKFGHVGFEFVFHLVTVIENDQFRGFAVDRLRLRRHDFHEHQFFDDFGDGFSERLGQIQNRHSFTIGNDRIGGKRGFDVDRRTDGSRIGTSVRRGFLFDGCIRLFLWRFVFTCHKITSSLLAIRLTTIQSCVRRRVRSRRELCGSPCRSLSTTRRMKTT